MLSPVEEIKNRLDIVDIIQGYLKLTKAGANYKANCPFHKEKTPSFVVSPEKQIWHCFGCGKGGDVFKFVMEIESLEFIEALRMLAQKAGIVLKKEDPKLRSQRERITEVNEASCNFFEKVLFSSEGEKARKYLEDRGIKKRIIKEFRIGYAPLDWRKLKDVLLERGFKEEDMVAAGMIIKLSDNPKPGYDRFRSRIMFPITNLAGHVVGFSGRIFPEPKDTDRPAAKYINSPNTPVYNKSKTLYGLSSARDAIRKNKFVILVEGNVDVLMSHQAGARNTLATCGTALNEDHLILLKRYTDKLKLCFDQDTAGVLATKGAIKKALSLGFSIKIITFEGGKDPADIVLKDPDSWKEIVKGGEEFLSYSLLKAKKEYSSSTPDGKKEIAKEILPLIKALANDIERSHWVNKLAELLGVDERYLYEALKKTKSTIVNKKEKDVIKELNKKEKSRSDILEEDLATVIIKYPQLLKEKLKDFNVKIVSNQNLRKSLEKFIKHPDAKTIAQDEVLGYLSLKADHENLYNDLNEEDIVNEFDIIIKTIGKEEIKKEQTEIINKIREAEKKGDSKGLEACLVQLQKTFDKT